MDFCLRRLPVALLERLLAVRDRLLASSSFQRWAAGFPPTRAVARRRAAALFDLCAGFVYSQVLYTCVKLEVFELLKHGPRSVHELCGATGLKRDPLLRLLHAAAALGLLQWRSYEKRCGLGRHGAALLGNPSLLQMISHHRLLYSDLLDPVALLRQESPPTSLSQFWAYARAHDPAAVSTRQVHAYTSLMSASQELITAEVLDAYNFGAHASLLDVGGGDGTFCAGAAARWPALRAVCFDLPTVAERARARFAAAGISQRAVAVGGNFLLDSLPRGSDALCLVRVLHDHCDGDALKILRSAHAALPAGGTLVVAEPMSGTNRGERAASAYLGFYLLAMGSGKPRTFEALAELVSAAGFAGPKLRATRLAMNVRVLTARR